jgi:hypothetical protein
VFHLTGWHQSVQPVANVLQNIAGIPDPILAVTGNDVRVPAQLPFLIGAAGLINDASLARVEIQSPSLRVRTNLDVEPIHNGLVWGNPSEINYWPDSPVPIVPNESLNAAVGSAPAAPVIHEAFVWLADGPQAPVTGNIFTIRATAAITLSSGIWVNGALTFNQVLPSGRYAVVGMRVRGANLVVARLVFPGQMPRPGVLAVSAIGNVDPYWPRFGRMGSWGEFDNTVPPTLDALGVTDTAQTLLLDLIQVK